MARLPGRATAAATDAYLARFHRPEGAVRALGGLSLSSVGVGTYLGHEDDECDARYREAIARALALGLNVVDTASSYRAQRSERAVGAALAAEVGAGRLAREEIVVASKVGYLPFDGHRPRHLGPWVEERFLAPGIFRREDLVGGVHCMAPRYIDHVLEQSRDNLGLETIDVYYLHNPESGREGLERGEWLRRIGAAFEALERAAVDGRIGCYGVATWNGLRKPAADPAHHGLDELLDLAHDVGGDGHHLRVAQLPYNLAMIEARTSGFLDEARARGVYVMASAPILQGQLASGLDGDLAAAIDASTPHAGHRWTDAQRALQFARSTPGIGTALVGASRAAHVEQAAAVAAAPPLDAATIDSLFGSFGD
jgi:aryl-alcohol dehydrogenase-like predicted oxidoreductase